MPLLVPGHNPVEQTWLISYKSLSSDLFALDRVRDHRWLHLKVLNIEFSAIIELDAILRLPMIRGGPILSDQGPVGFNPNFLINETLGTVLV